MNNFFNLLLLQKLSFVNANIELQWRSNLSQQNYKNSLSKQTGCSLSLMATQCSLSELCASVKAKLSLWR